MFRVIHFEFSADDIARARQFYTHVFGWSFTKTAEHEGWEYWAIDTGDPAAPGIHGGMSRRMGPSPAADAPLSGCICTVDVPDIDATLAKVIAAGGQVVMEKAPVQDVGWMAYFKDTEGNFFAVLQGPTPAIGA